MTGLVLDASVTASWLLEDEVDSQTGASLDSVRQDGALVPQLWHYEIRNALLVAQRRGRLHEDEVIERLASLGQLPILTDREPDLQITMELAIARGLSFYDAMYVELARRRQLPLATLDAALARAAIAEGLDIASA